MRSTLTTNNEWSVFVGVLVVELGSDPARMADVTPGEYRPPKTVPRDNKLTGAME